MQGLFKVSLHKVFKTRYVELLGQEKASEWRTRLDLAASALAEFFTDVAPAPVEAGKLSFQRCGAAVEEADPLHHEVRLLQTAVEALCKDVVPKPQCQRTKAEQLAMTFVAGHMAGVFCAIVSHPADSVVSVLNKEKGCTAFGALHKLGFGGVWKGLFAQIF
ncbi:Phosphate Carrier Protein [Manis pentadactyla]|nr:Phosphate Carrier Protein [Manis pentadactyla]